MQAVLCKHHGPPEALVMEQVPSPTPKAGEVVVRVKAASVNFHDALMIQNLHQHKPPLPFSPGSDIAGTVEQIGEGVRGFRRGDAVIGLLRFGGYAEEAVVPSDRLAVLPAGIDFSIAASFGLPYTTSYYALKNCARLKPGETLLVLGAAGSIGTAAIELGRVMGARVIACASSAERLAVCRNFGAHETIDYRTEDLRESIRRLTEGRGVDVVCDPLGGKFSEIALRGIASQGRHLVIGFAAGAIPKIPTNLTLVKGCSILGVSRGQFMNNEAEQSRINLEELLVWLAAGKLQPLIPKEYPLAEAGSALNDMINHKLIGRAVLVV